MKWLKRLGKLVLFAVVAVVVGVGLIFVTHPRDEEAFLEYHRTYPDITNGRRPGELLAEGDAACDWLNSELHVVFQPSTRAGTGSLLDRYLGPPPEGPRRFAARGSGATASVAWKNLCGGSLALIQWSHVWQGLSKLQSD